ncbi:unnamed protein product [Amoebophrya sp. A25]|nr:unnamed protein product [Amoebophrya sp. A25]|eukprot:GSA25T00026658001.1
MSLLRKTSLESACKMSLLARTMLFAFGSSRQKNYNTLFNILPMVIVSLHLFLDLDAGPELVHAATPTSSSSTGARQGEFPIPYSPQHLASSSSRPVRNSCDLRLITQHKGAAPGTGEAQHVLGGPVLVYNLHTTGTATGTGVVVLNPHVVGGGALPHSRGNSKATNDLQAQIPITTSAGVVVPTVSTPTASRAGSKATCTSIIGAGAPVLDVPLASSSGHGTSPTAQQHMHFYNPGQSQSQSHQSSPWPPTPSSRTCRIRPAGVGGSGSFTSAASGISYRPDTSASEASANKDSMYVKSAMVNEHLEACQQRPIMPGTPATGYRPMTGPGTPAKNSYNRRGSTARARGSTSAPESPMPLIPSETSGHDPVWTSVAPSTTPKRKELLRESSKNSRTTTPCSSCPSTLGEGKKPSLAASINGPLLASSSKAGVSQYEAKQPPSTASQGVSRPPTAATSVNLQRPSTTMSRASQQMSATTSMELLEQYSANSGTGAEQGRITTTANAAVPTGQQQQPSTSVTGTTKLTSASRDLQAVIAETDCGWGKAPRGAPRAQPSQYECDSSKTFALGGVGVTHHGFIRNYESRPPGDTSRQQARAPNRII